MYRHLVFVGHGKHKTDSDAKVESRACAICFVLECARLSVMSGATCGVRWDASVRVPYP